LTFFSYLLESPGSNFRAFHNSSLL
jgi:hypothetical protein